MTIWQKINGETYFNEVKTDLADVDDDYLESVLRLMNDKIIKHEKATQILRNQRTGLVKFAFDRGMSAIKIGNILNMSRQSVYAILEKEDK